MQYIHYWHFQRAWYSEVTDKTKPQRICWHNSCYVQDHWNKRYLIEGSNGLTHREIKKKLRELYPNYNLVKDKPFHYGARWHGYKHGSRS